MKKTNQKLIDTIEKLKERARSEDVALYNKVAQELEKPTTKKVVVNVGKIQRYTEKGDVVIVPGKVLSVGFLDHKVKVIAYNFSKNGKKKVEEKGKAVYLTDYISNKKLDQNIKVII